jgi:hypothetical protein
MGENMTLPKLIHNIFPQKFGNIATNTSGKFEIVALMRIN